MNHLARALALTLLAAPALCQTPRDRDSDTRQFTPTPLPPQVSMRALLYDTEGKMGGGYPPSARSVIPTGEYGEYQFKDEQPTRIDFLNWSYNATKPVGTPFLFRLHSSQLGSFLGFYRVTQNDPVFFHIPVKGSEVGLPPLREDRDGSHVEELMTISVETWIADNRLLPSVTLSAYWIPDIDSRQVIMESHYLEGNRFEGLGTEYWNFEKGADPYVDLAGLWGDYIALLGSVDADEAGFTEEGAPDGPMRVVAGIEGYGNDSIEFEGKNKTNFGFVYMLFGDFSSDPSVMTPSEIMGLTTLSVPEHRFILEPAIREDLLGQSHLFTNLLSASDVNHDGVIDAADYLIVRPQALPTPTPGGTPTPFPTATPFPASAEEAKWRASR